MGKNKKKHSKKNDLSGNVLDVAALSLKKFRKVTKEIGRLSTGQKLVGGVALLAAGLAYLASQDDAPAATAPADAGARQGSGPPAATLGDDGPAPHKSPKAPGKSRKGPKAS